MLFPKKDKYQRPRTPYAIHCVNSPLGEIPGCGLVYLTKKEYNFQLSRPSKTWRCPICGMYDAQWDDNNYEEFLEKEQ